MQYPLIHTSNIGELCVLYIMSTVANAAAAGALIAVGELARALRTRLAHH